MNPLLYPLALLLVLWGLFLLCCAWVIVHIMAAVDTLLGWIAGGE